MIKTRLAIFICGLIYCACAVVKPPETPPDTDKTVSLRLGIDNLIADNFGATAGKRIALLTNSAGRTSDLRTAFDVFRSTPYCRLTTVLTPEHGFDAAVPAGSAVANDTINSIPFFSLYGKFRRPTREMLADCDAVVADIQDIGIRSYTFVSSLRNVMDACAEFGKPIIVLDRPNPLGGILVDGAPAEDDALSFVAALPVPYLHGCTIGELARMMNEENWLPAKRKAKLTVIPMSSWKRSMTWENTGLPWFPTSPNVPSPETIRAMAITGILGEAGGVNIGIGSALPFRYLGRPDSLAAEIISKIEQISMPCKIARTRFRTETGTFGGQICSGLILLPDAEQKRYFSAGIALLAELRTTLPGIMRELNKKDSMLRKVLANKALCNALANGDTLENILKIATKGEDEFRRLREKYLLYGG
ncbi:DUF1343 domain-containing protein [Ignavibacteria bacterium]|nr:DUF1343 domain-containing protein [Bacteroidota bacterium]MCZ2131808.1 DUF1343 domain-containing protein [Bacteroidota bacterium]